jgi:2-polyprenyl-6-methoxyphenol hydroxylase-like FAD-dependent oxidoreductase
MKSHNTYDIIIAGGGIAGSLFAGVMARAGVSAFLIEKEARFRDRIRGESIFPWGVAEVMRLGVREVFDRAGAVEIVGLRSFEDRQPADPYYWAPDSIDGLPMLGFEHPRLQEAAIAWATEQGVTVARPAKMTDIDRDGQHRVARIQTRDGQMTARARLIVGADGKTGASRRWTGGSSRSDPKHHLLGGVLVSGIDWPERFVDMVSNPRRVNYWFPVSTNRTRIFLALTPEQHAETAIASSFERFMALVGEEASPDRFARVEQAGPLGFFPNQCTWATQVTGPGVVLIGDAAGSLDPTQGHGTSHLMRDIRVLSDLLTTESHWPSAIEIYARQRQETYDVLRAFDRWMVAMRPATGDEATRLREGHLRAIEADPALGGWRMLSSRGPDGLRADEASRRHFFGDDR